MKTIDENTIIEFPKYCFLDHNVFFLTFCLLSYIINISGGFMFLVASVARPTVIN